MSVNPELLTKAAKVYDCSEPVEGMKPKMQYEEHKKMTPDEFSRENTKQAYLDDYNALRTNHNIPLGYGGVGAGVGGLVGGLYGAATGKKGKKLNAILRGVAGGALTGGGAGLGAGYAVRAALPEAKDPRILGLFHGPGIKENLNDYQDRLHRETFGMTRDEMQKRLGTAALLGGGLGLAGGGVAATALTDQSDDEDTKKKAAAPVPPTKAAQFGVRAAHAILPIMERQFKKQSAGPGFTASGAPTAGWSNPGYNPHKPINTPPALKTPDGLNMASDHMANANRARYQFATANNPQAKLNASTAFATAARAANSANVAGGGKPVYSPTQKPMD